MKKIFKTSTLFAAAAIMVSACSEGDTKPLKRQTAETRTGAYLSARHAVRAGDRKSASDYYAQSLANDPSNRVLALRALFAHVHAGRVSDAAKLAEKLHKTDPKNLSINMILLAQAAGLKDDKRMGELGLALPKNNSNQLLISLLRAWTIYAAQKSTGPALQALVTLSADQKYRVFANVHAGMIADLADKPKIAGPQFRTALTSLRLPALRLTQTAANFFARRDEKKTAENILRAYLKIYPETVAIQIDLQRVRDGEKQPRFVNNPAEGIAEVFLNIAQGLKSGNRADAAVFFGQLAAHIRPNDTATLLLLGSLMDDEKQYASAVKTYQRVDPKAPLFWRARRAKVSSLAALKRDKEAIALLKAMTDERPDRWDAPAILGNLYRRRSKFNEAAAAYDQAIKRIKKIEKRHWNLFYNRGVALERAKKWQRAEKDFKHALKLSPDHPYVLNYLAYSWVERGINLEQAKAMLQKAVKRRPRDGAIVDSVGWVYYRLGQFDLAVKNLERASELRPQDPTINDHLGDAYWRTGRRHEARFQWRRALSLKPEKEEIPKINAKLKNGMAPFKPLKKQP